MTDHPGLFFSRLIWLFPIAFAIHIAEEVAGFPGWVTETLGGVATTRGFLVSNFFFMIFLLTFCILAAKVQKVWATTLLFAWLGTQQFGNFVFHFYSQIAFSIYSPGVISATFLYYPIYLFIGFIAVRERHISRKGFLLCTFLGTPFMCLLAWANIYRFGSIPLDKWLMLN